MLCPFSKDYLHNNGEFTILLEEFELLGALAYLGQVADMPALKIALERQDQWGRNYVDVPTGLLAGDLENREIIFGSLEGVEKSNHLLKAGFAHGNKEYLENAIVNLQRVHPDRPWYARKS